MIPNKFCFFVRTIIQVLKYLALAMWLRWFMSTREDALFFIGVWGLISAGLWGFAWLIDRSCCRQQ